MTREPQTVLASSHSSCRIVHSAWSRYSPFRRNDRRSTPSCTAPSFRSAPFPRPFFSAARASSRCDAEHVEREIHHQLRAVHEHPRAPELRRQREAPLRRPERRLERAHLEDPDRRVRPVRHDREAHILPRLPLPNRPADEAPEALDRRRRRRDEPDTCSLDSAANSAGASLARSSRRLTRFPVRHGSPVRQSVVTVGGVCSAASGSVGSRCD